MNGASFVPELSFLILVVGMAGCSFGGGGKSNDTSQPPVRSGLRLSSPAFAQGQLIPKKYTGEGQDVSPPLAWEGAPPETKSFVLFCDDPDAPSPRRPAPEPWVHWVIYNIPADATSLPEAITRQAEVAEPAGARQGKNSWPRDHVGYRGPMPPAGSGQHRYRFHLYALDTTLELPAQLPSKKDIIEAMQGHVFGEASLTGVYEIPN